MNFYLYIYIDIHIYVGNCAIHRQVYITYIRICIYAKYAYIHSLVRFTELKNTSSKIHSSLSEVLFQINISEQCFKIFVHMIVICVIDLATCNFVIAIFVTFLSINYAYIYRKAQSLGKQIYF